MKLLKRFLVYGIPAIIVIGGLIAAGGMLSVRKADAKKPWSVLVKSYRQKEDAELAADRLKKMKFGAYYVSKMGRDNDIWFDVQAGACRSKKEAENIKNRLALAGLGETQVINYSNYINDSAAYNNAKPDDKKAFQGKYEIPEISTNIVLTMKRFPVDRNYKIVDLRLADAPFLIRNNMVNIGFKPDDNFIPDDIRLHNLIKSSASLSQALYEDKLTGNQIDVLILSLTNSNADALPPAGPYHYGNLELKDMNYRTDTGALRGNIYRMRVHGNNIYTFLGKIEKTPYFVLYKTYDLTLKEMTAFISNNNGDKGLLLYPEVIKNLSVFPKKSNTGSARLAAFSMFRIQWNYAKDRNFSWWSKNMIGYWNMNGYYMYCSKPIVINIFNLDYTKTASAIHNNFIYEKRKTLNNNFLAALMKENRVFNKQVDVNHNSGWFLDRTGLNELSFSRGPYIVAIDSFYPRKSDYAALKAAASSLNIW